jgi:hypothetical protein
MSKHERLTTAIVPRIAAFLFGHIILDWLWDVFKRID